MVNKDSLTISGQYNHIKEICAFVSTGAKHAGLDDDSVFQVELACDEACTNIIEHAYREEGIGDITVTWEATLQSFTITLHDKGRSFDPDAVRDPTLVKPNTNPQDLKVGGLGIHFIRNLMDEVHYQFDKQGNTLIMVKYIESYP